MENILFGRLQTLVVSTLGANYAQDISKLVVVIMTFIENEVHQLELKGTEKLKLLLTWLEKLLANAGKKLLSEEEALVVGFVSRICEATKGMFGINTSSTSSSSSGSSKVKRKFSIKSCSN